MSFAKAAAESKWSASTLQVAVFVAKSTSTFVTPASPANVLRTAATQLIGHDIPGTLKETKVVGSVLGFAVVSSGITTSTSDVVASAAGPVGSGGCPQPATDSRTRPIPVNLFMVSSFLGNAEISSNIRFGHPLSAAPLLVEGKPWTGIRLPQILRNP